LKYPTLYVSGYALNLLTTRLSIMTAIPWLTVFKDTALNLLGVAGSAIWVTKVQID